jgi:hypothetical protein
MKEIADIIDKFDFQRVHAYMTLTNWVWLVNDLGTLHRRVPTVNDLKDSARSLLSEIMDPKCDVESLVQPAGGFRVKKHVYGNGDVMLGLSFEICVCDEIFQQKEDSP